MDHAAKNASEGWLLIRQSPILGRLCCLCRYAVDLALIAFNYLVTLKVAVSALMLRYHSSIAIPAIEGLTCVKVCYFHLAA